MMEFHEKIQELRQKRGLTQEELAEALFVSRAAVSKWESGRGYPNIDSLKALSKFYRVTIDELLSGDELLTIAEEDTKEKETHLCDLVFGGLDCVVALFLPLPLFGQRSEGLIREVSLLRLTEISPWLRQAYLFFVCALICWGILTLALQNCDLALWRNSKRAVSLGLNIGATLLFILGMQPYAAAFLFVFLIIKVALLIKKR